MSKTPPQPWPELLRALSVHLLGVADELDLQHVRPAQLRSRWLGKPPATETAIAAREQRLGIRLPPSYREFLLASNGWPTLAGFPYGICSLVPIQHLNWFPVVDRTVGALAGYVRDYGQVPLRKRPADLRVPVEELQGSLAIGVGDGNEYVLLSSTARRKGEEWPIWTYHHECGFDRHPSFRALMEDGLGWSPY